MAKYAGQLQSQLRRFQDAGYKSGGKGLPPTTATALDQNETKLHADAERYALDEHSQYKKIEVGKAKTLAEVEHSLSEFEANSATLLSDRELGEVTEHAMAQERSQLIKYRKEQLEREADLKSFRALNGINQQADYPPDRLWTFAWLAVVIVIETVVNAVFYENANGLIGGAVVALAVSVVNLGAAWVLGHGITYKNLRALELRIFGWSCLFLAVILSVYLNAVFATFRAEYQLVTDPTDLAQTGIAFRSAMEAAGQVFYLRFPASDFMSFILFFIGLLLSAFAFLKGYSFDDKFPGHGNLDRLYKKAEAAFEGLGLIVKEKIRLEIERKRNELASAKNQLQQNASLLGQIRSSLAGTYAEMQVSLKQIQNEFTLVLKSYRHANTAVRPVAAPEYFSHTPDVISIFAEDAGDAMHPQLDSLDRRATDLRERYMLPLTEKLSQLTEEGKEILGKTYGQFLFAVTDEAKEHINKEKMVMPTQFGFGYEQK